MAAVCHRSAEGPQARRLKVTDICMRQGKLSVRDHGGRRDKDVLRPLAAVVRRSKGGGEGGGGGGGGLTWDERDVGSASPQLL
ncbi:hypothetical protein JOB18_031033 [Solea senegalensis]|uniref:Uncharacterized protein n=1 Tax=Solea senegalensis TaxID=28829 RepID=A0AAV6RA54_SOLSE|nr:hypothetical protein JOB18_031033 [Solea senegalensis]